MSDIQNAEHEVGRDDLAAYALGALERAEAARIEAHLSGCESCREYVSWLDPALDLLPAAVPQLAPPRSLKKSLMAEVAADRKAAVRAGKTPWAERLRATLGRPAAAALACAVLVAGGVTGYLLRGDDGAPESVFVQAEPGPRPEPGMKATLEVAGDRGTLHVEDLPALPAGRVYQAWIQRDGKMEPSTPFVVRRDGSNEVAIDGTLEGAAGVYVTREPKGGSTEPTPPVVMKALL